MIIVKLMGGLGNQMFQYATARRLACYHKTILKLDPSQLKNSLSCDTHREYELNIFDIDASFATKREVSNISNTKQSIAHTMFSNLLMRAGLKGPSFISIKERCYHFEPAILTAPDNAYLDGYWQSQKYFFDIENIIRQEFSFKNQMDTKNASLADEIIRTNSVSLHVRRGDYVAIKNINQHHGVCSKAYYERGVAEIVQKVASPHFFLFSDDPDWVRSNINISFPNTVIDNNISGKGYEDLRLMSLCRHNIIANSTFSWWGAWLNCNVDKIVVSPSRWFTNPGIYIGDLIPRTWLSMEV